MHFWSLWVYTRWFKVTILVPLLQVTLPLKGSLNYPKKVTKNCQVQIVCHSLKQKYRKTQAKLTKLLGDGKTDVCQNCLPILLGTCEPLSLQPNKSTLIPTRWFKVIRNWSPWKSPFDRKDTLQGTMVPGEKENHLQKGLGRGYVSSLEGTNPIPPPLIGMWLICLKHSKFISKSSINHFRATVSMVSIQESKTFWGILMVSNREHGTRSPGIFGGSFKLLCLALRSFDPCIIATWRHLGSRLRGTSTAMTAAGQAMVVREAQIIINCGWGYVHVQLSRNHLWKPQPRKSIEKTTNRIPSY